MFFNEIKKVMCGESFSYDAFTAHDWPLFISELDQNGLLPFFYHFSRAHPAIPESVEAAARKRYEDALVFKDYSCAVLKEIEPDLSNIGRVVCLKGWALSECIYGEPLVRPMGDIDIYLPDGSINEVVSVFKKLGFSQFGTYEKVLTNGNIHLDIHEDLWNARRVPARRGMVAGITESFVPSSLVPGFFVPSPELLAVHTAYHCVKHNFSRLIWALDIQMIYRAGYFNALKKETAYPFVPYVLEWLAVRGLIDYKEKAAQSVSGMQRHLLNAVTGGGQKSGLGEIALALLCRSPLTTFGYLANSLVPPIPVLKEMYGNRSLGGLLVCRVMALFNHVCGVLSWKKS